MFFSCLPPFTGKTVAGGPSHLVGLNSTFSCCSMHPGDRAGPTAIAAWYGGPNGSSLVLQRHVMDFRGVYVWITVAKAAGRGPPSLSRLCYPAGFSRPIGDEFRDLYRLIQVAAPKPSLRPRIYPWVVWLDKVSYLGTAVVAPDTWNPGIYPTCP